MKMDAQEVHASDGSVCYQSHLVGFGFSGRVVRYRELPDEIVDEIEDNAAALAGAPPEDEGERARWMSRIQRRAQRFGANRFTVEISEQPVDPRNYPACEGVKYKRMTAQLMEAESSGGGLLKGKDLKALGQLYSQLHHVTFGEVQELMGKAIQVV